MKPPHPKLLGIHCHYPEFSCSRFDKYLLDWLLEKYLIDQFCCHPVGIACTLPMQRVGASENPYTLYRVVDHLFVERNNLIRVVVPAPTFDGFLSFACNAPIAVPTRCHRCSSAPPCQVGTFHRNQGRGRQRSVVLPPGSNTVAVSGVATLASKRGGHITVAMDD